MTIKVQLKREVNGVMQQVNPITSEECVILSDGKKLNEVIDFATTAEDFVDEAIAIEENLVDRVESIENRIVSEFEQQNSQITTGLSNIKTIEQNISNKVDTEVAKVNAQLSRKINYGDGGVVTSAMLSQELREELTGGKVAVVGKDTVLSTNIVDNEVTKSKLSTLEVLSQYSNVSKEMKEEFDNCYYDSSSYEVTSHNQYKIINIYANSDDIYFYFDNLYRVYDFLGSPTEKNMVNHVGGGDDAGEQFYVLKKGHTLGITISKSKEANAVIKYAPYFTMKGLKVDCNNLIGKVGKDSVEFVKSVSNNLFDGKYFNEYYINANPADGEKYAFSTTQSKSVIVSIEPNTEYTILKEKTEIEGDYFYFKVATFTVDRDTLLSQSFYPVDGSVRYSNTKGSVSSYKFTTGENDKTLMVVVSKVHEPYLELLKGNHNNFISNSYEPEYEFTGINVYSKSEVDKLIENINHNISKNNLGKVGNIIDITLDGKVGYRLERNVKSNINLDTWMLTRGTVNDITLWSGSDIEAPIKEVGTEDFIGGVHGDEKIESVQIICDGVLLDLGSDYNLNFNNLTVFVKSTLFRCNTDVPVFTRYKKLEFVNNELIVSNRLICLVDNFLVNRHTGCGLYSVYKDLLIGYTVNTKPELITSGATSQNAELDCGTFYGNGFTVTLKTLSGKTEYYKGSVADFASESRPRYKLYFDCINSSSGVRLNTNDELNTSFSIKIA